jgi:hypothetical protein
MSVPAPPGTTLKPAAATFGPDGPAVARPAAIAERLAGLRATAVAGRPR